MGTDKIGRIGDVTDVVLIIFISLLFISPAMLPASSAAVAPDEDFHVVTIERPFFKNVTQIAHNDENIYIGTDSNGLIIYDQETGTFEVKNTSNSFPLDSVDFVQWEDEEEMLFFTSRENIPYPENTSIIPWVYSYDGVDIVPIENFTYTSRPKTSMLVKDDNIFLNGRYMLKDYKNTSVPVHFFGVITPDIYGVGKGSDDMLLIDNHLYRFQEVFHLLGNIAYSLLVNYDLNSNLTYLEPYKGVGLLHESDESHVYALAYDHTGTVYVGSEQGILMVNADTMNKTGNITMDDGLISNDILDLEYSDNRNTLFASSKDGLSMIDLNTNNITNLDQSDGLLSNKINCIDWNEERSELYIGHDNGISILTIEDNTDRPKISHALVTQATVGKPIPITATITDGSDISSAIVYYRPTDQANFTSIEMEGDDDYTAQIPSTPTPGKLEYYIEASDIYGNENRTDVYEVDVVKEGASMQAKDGYIPGTDMTSSVIITAIILLIAVLFVTFFYYSKEKRKN